MTEMERLQQRVEWLERELELTRKLQENIDNAIRGSGISVWGADVVGDPPQLSDRPWIVGANGDVDDQQRAVDTMAPEYHVPMWNAISACIRGETDKYELEHRTSTADGTPGRWIFSRGRTIRDAAGTPLRFVGSSMDITALKEEARRNKERLELSILGSKTCAWDFELDNGKLVDARATYPNVFELLGYTAADDTHRFPDALAVLIPPEGQAAFVADIQGHLDGTSREWENVYSVRHKDGSERWHLSRGVIQRDAAGVARRLTGISIDITERIRADRALRESEQRFRGRYENASLRVSRRSAEGMCL